MATPTVICVGSIFIDDIVYPDGRTDMGVLGGGGVHTTAGMLVWGERAGLVATWGAGMPEAAAERLRQDFDLSGILTTEHAQVRAWQLFEWDGKRTEIYRVDVVEPFMEAPRPAGLAPHFRDARAMAVLRDDTAFRAWRAALPEALVLWEPEQAWMTTQNRAAFRDALPLAEIVSPNLLEASLVYGQGEPDALVDAMLADGARIVALRLGERGSLVASPDERLHIPAVPVETIIDQTGAGNTYCGAFLLGWLRHGSLAEAAVYGAVAASFALERVGVLVTPPAAERDRRAAALRAELKLPPSPAAVE